MKSVKILLDHGAQLSTDGCLTIAIELYNQEVILALGLTLIWYVDVDN